MAFKSIGVGHGNLKTRTTEVIEIFLLVQWVFLSKPGRTIAQI